MTVSMPRHSDDQENTTSELGQDLEKRERKRHQNRVAQRTYRRNQKQRLQALEAAVARSTDVGMLASPPASTTLETPRGQPLLPIDFNGSIEPIWNDSQSTPSPQGVPLLDDGRTALHLAVCSGNESMTTLLLERGADIGRQDNSGKTPLYLAAENGHDRLVELLLDKAADPNETDFMGRTPLFAAVQFEHESVVRLLLESAVDVNAKDILGNVALHLAVAGESEALTVMLLGYGANVNA